MNIAFDKDGTLHDSFPEFVIAFNKALGRLDVAHVTEEQLRAIYSSHWKTEVLPAVGVTEDRYKLFIDTYVEEYKKRPLGSMIPGVPEMLQHVAEKSELVQLVTNEQSDKPERFITTNNIQTFFSGITKPRSHKHEALTGFDIYVGDTISDGLCAMRAGCIFIAVGHQYAYNIKDILARFVAEQPERRYLAETVDEIPQLVTKL